LVDPTDTPTMTLRRLCSQCSVPRETVVFEQHYRSSWVIVRSSDSAEMPLTTQNHLVSMHTSTTNKE